MATKKKSPSKTTKKPDYVLKLERKVGSQERKLRDLTSLFQSFQERQRIRDDHAIRTHTKDAIDYTRTNDRVSKIEEVLEIKEPYIHHVVRHPSHMELSEDA